MGGGRREAAAAAAAQATAQVTRGTKEMNNPVFLPARHLFSSRARRVITCSTVRRCRPRPSTPRCQSRSSRCRRRWEGRPTVSRRRALSFSERRMVEEEEEEAAAAATAQPKRWHAGGLDSVASSLQCRTSRRRPGPRPRAGPRCPDLRNARRRAFLLSKLRAPAQAPGRKVWGGCGKMGEGPRCLDGPMFVGFVPAFNRPQFEVIRAI